MAVHHINPHVMPRGHDDNHRDNKFHFDDSNDIFKNLDHVFHQNMNPGQSHGHSFTATYSNNNGKVTKHFEKDGRTVNDQDASQMMKEMHQQMNDMGKIFGDFDNDLGFNDHKDNNNLDGIIGNHPKHHHHPFRHLADHFRK